MAKVDTATECRKIEKFIEAVGKQKANIRLNTGVTKLALSNLADMMKGAEDKDKKKLLGIINEMADTTERIVLNFEDVQEFFEKEIKRQLGCK